MDLRSIANSASSVVNDNVIVSLRVSTGFTVGAGAKQVPTYAAAVSGPAQIQALDSSDLKQLDGIMQQGTYRAIYLRGALHGIIRPDGTGGDLIDVAGKTWKVTKVLESWANWTKAAICLQ